MIKPVRPKLTLQNQEQLIARALGRLLRCEVVDQINRIILFGSASCRELTDVSDIDLCVIIQNGSDLKKCKKAIYATPRDNGDETPYDILIFDENTFKRKMLIGGLCEIIERDGEVLYVKGGG